MWGCGGDYFHRIVDVSRFCNGIIRMSIGVDSMSPKDVVNELKYYTPEGWCIFQDMLRCLKRKIVFLDGICASCEFEYCTGVCDGKQECESYKRTGKYKSMCDGGSGKQTIRL